MVRLLNEDVLKLPESKDARPNGALHPLCCPTSTASGGWIGLLSYRPVDLPLLAPLPLILQI